MADLGFFSCRRGLIFAVVFLWFSLICIRESAATGAFPTPPNCGKLECPSYDVVFSGKDFEIRRYKKALWISTPPISGNSFQNATAKGFGPLFAYIEGKNAKSKKIGMTAPVVVDISPFAGTFTVRFYLPRKFQKKPPTSSEVRAETWPGPQYAAVRRFGGVLVDPIIPIQATLLREAIRGSPFEEAIIARPGGPTTYTIAGYSSPDERVNHINEVMFLF
ncbi:uncharacterized protein LOC144705522 [Wolffia australiana]